MSRLGKYFLVGIISYLIGNFSSAYILGKLFKRKDVREYGSGNAGATNALRVFGIKIGLIAFILDVLKGVLATTIGNKIAGFNGALIASIFVVLGHNWPIFLKFKGGKGIATSLGAMLYLHWPTTIFCTIIAIVVIAMTKYVSLGSILGAILLPILGNIVKRPFSLEFFFTTMFLGIMALWRHRSNIQRLLSGTESKLGDKIH